MKNQTAPMFDELMKSYYGVASGPELSNTAKVEALLTDYYGRPYKRKSKTPAAAVSLSLSQDNGEVLPQPDSCDQFEEYVVQKCPAVPASDEYVVRNGPRSPERATASSLNIGRVEPVSAGAGAAAAVGVAVPCSRTSKPRSVATTAAVS